MPSPKQHAVWNRSIEEENMDRQRKAKEKADKEKKKKKDNTPKKVRKKKSVREMAIAAAAHDKEMRDMGGVPHGRLTSHGRRYITETAGQKRERENPDMDVPAKRTRSNLVGKVAPNPEDTDELPDETIGFSPGSEPKFAGSVTFGKSPPPESLPQPKFIQKSTDKSIQVSERVTVKIHCPVDIGMGSIVSFLTPDGQRHFVRSPTAGLVRMYDGSYAFTTSVPRQYGYADVRRLDFEEIRQWLHHRGALDPNQVMPAALLRDADAYIRRQEICNPLDLMGETPETM